MRFRIRRGLDLPIGGEPLQRIHDGPPVRHVGLVAADYPGLRARAQVRVGDRVRAGESLFADRKSPGIRFVTPAAGVVREVNVGARRRLQSVVVEVDEHGDGPPTFPALAPDEIERLAGAQVRERLLEAGLWPALRMRPFDRVPPADGSPAALFVTAVDTRPLAPDPRLVIDDRPEDFAAGLVALTRVAAAPTYVCTDGRPPPALPSIDGLRHVAFVGPHPAGLPGTHIHFVSPVRRDRPAWHVGYQDVVAVGSLFRTGRAPVDRVLSVAGPSVRAPRVVRTILGASIEDLLTDETTGPARPVSGAVLGGRHAFGPFAYVGRYHDQVTALPEAATGRPGRRHSWTRAFASRWVGRGAFRLDTARNGPVRPLFPAVDHGSLLPLDLLPLPLFRALLVRDAETAEELGALELVEEDLALCTYACPSKIDYGLALREVLDALERGA